LQRGPALRYLLLAASGLIGLAALYVLDVWLLGALAAMISGQLVFARTHPLFSLTGRYPSRSAPINPAAWYWHHPRSVYKRHGAQTARSLAKRILGRWLSREELRFLCWIEKDDESYVHAIETHRLAWDQTG